MDIIVYSVSRQYGVPLINYAGAFSNAQTGYNGAVSPGGTAQGFAGPFFTSTNTATSVNAYSAYQPTAAGYAVMTMMAQTAFATVNAQLTRSLFTCRDTLLQGNECGAPCNGIPNVNTVSPGNTVQFYPVISYTNGVTQQAGLNVNFLLGSHGTWTSGNPLVGFVNQSGEFWAFNQGTTTSVCACPTGCGTSGLCTSAHRSPGE